MLLSPSRRSLEMPSLPNDRAALAREMFATTSLRLVLTAQKPWHRLPPKSSTTPATTSKNAIVAAATACSNSIRWTTRSISTRSSSVLPQRFDQKTMRRIHDFRHEYSIAERSPADIGHSATAFKVADSQVASRGKHHRIQILT